MEKYFSSVPKPTSKDSSTNLVIKEVQSSSKPQPEVSSHFANDRERTFELVGDPAKRKQISEFHPDIQDEVRKAYLKKGPQQNRRFKFPPRSFGNKTRYFSPTWFDLHDWLEYSERDDKAFCLPCYLFKNVSKNGGEHFVSIGFTGWNNPHRLHEHVNTSNGSHNDCVHMGLALMNPRQSIGASLVRQSKQQNIDYRIRVNTSLVVAKHLLRCGMPFRGHDESKDSSYKGLFLETIELLKESNEDIDKVLKCAPGNNCMTSPSIQKELAASCAFEVTKKILGEIGDDNFCVLVDESSDCSGKEQMAVVLCYVNSAGFVVERFLGIVHVRETSAKLLKEALVSLLGLHKLSLSNIRGQGYDGASNMKGHLGGLRTLIQNENPSAYYVHCFAHQLQLALVVCSKKHTGVSDFFGRVNMLVNLVRCSTKKMELLRCKQKIHYTNLIEEGLIETGTGLNQESSIVRAGDTRWGSHFRTLTSLIKLYGPLIAMLEDVSVDTTFDRHGEATTLLYLLQSFDFIFMLFLLVDVLGITFDMNLALQKCDQDILNSLDLVNIAKHNLQELRDVYWEELLLKVVSICNKHDIDVPDMDAPYIQGKKARGKAPSVSNRHHYKDDCLFSILDLQLQELNARFDEGNTELLQCVACLSPALSFKAFDVDKLVRMIELYPNDFVDVHEVIVRNQLRNYIIDVRSNSSFFELKGIQDLCQKLVETNKSNTYWVVFKLLKLALILPVATASVERSFSAMKYVKSELCNKMSDQWLNDRLVTFIERDILSTISNDVILIIFNKCTLGDLRCKCMNILSKIIP